MSTAISVYHGRFGRATLYELNRPMTTHAHREGHVIFHLRGAGIVTVSGRKYTVTAGNSVAVNPWEPHSFVPADPEEGLLALTLYINPSWFLGGGSHGGFRFGRTEIEVTDTIARASDRVIFLLLGARPISLFDGYLHELTSACFEESWRNGEPGEQDAPHDNPISDFRVRKSIRLIAEHVGEDIELDAVAREAGLSRPHFYKLFRRQTGVTPHIYLNTLLMERAIERLSETESSVTEIGFDLGFSSQSSFTRFFAANVGMPPTDYRRVVHVLRS